MGPNKSSPDKEQSYLRNVSSVKVTVTKTISIPAGAAGSVVDFDIPVRPIASLTGADLGGVGNTSLVLGSSATFDTLVNPKEDASLANGEYYVDHLTGQARGKKKDTGTSVSATFGVYAMKVMVESDEDDSVATATMQNAVSASGNGTSLNVQGMATALLLISGTYTGTVYFEGSIDDSTWNPIFACKLGDGTIAGSTTGTGLFRLPVAGLKSLRARVSWSSGTSVTVAGRASMLSSSGEDAAFARLLERISGEDIDRSILNVEETGASTRITSAATTIALASPGALLGVLVEVALTGTLTIYDNTAASGTIITILPIGTPAGYYRLPRKITTGVTGVTSASDRAVIFAKS